MGFPRESKQGSQTPRPLSVAILGASAKPGRYARLAQEALLRHGYAVYPVTQRGGEVLGLPAYADVRDIPHPVDTVTVYLRPPILLPMLDGIIAISPRRVIFNPGTESPEAMACLREQGIQALEACTLVLLRTGQFETAR